MTANTNIEDKILLFLLAAIALVVAPHFFNLPLTIFGFFGILLIWRLMAVRNHNLLPGTALLFIVMCLGIFLIFKQHQGFIGHEAGTSLFVTALGLKLLEIRTKRDLYLLTYLAFLVAATQFLFSQDILLAVYILVVSCLLIGLLVNINSQSLRLTQCIKLAATLIFQSLPIMAILFILFPRIEAPRWSFLQQNNNATSGLSDRLEPGAISNLALSGELAFRAKFDGKLPPPKQRYWRGPVFSFTDGKRWTPSNYLRRPIHDRKPRLSGQSYQYKLLLEPQNKKWVFALDLPGKLPKGLFQQADYQVTSKKSLRKRTEYKLVSFPQYTTGPLSNTERKENLQLPQKSYPKINQLVVSLGGKADQPERFIDQVMRYFADNDFRYTLTPPQMLENPIEAFLFDTRQGFCSHYATAFVVLMRTAQIPARVIAGYQGGIFNDIGNFLEVRQADAHAWAEVWLPNKGWVRVDPTTAIAPERIERSIDISNPVNNSVVRFSGSLQDQEMIGRWLKKLQFLGQSAEYNWQRFIINYNGNIQQKLFGHLGINDISQLVGWLVSSIAILIAIVAFFLLRNPKKYKDPILLLYEQFCKKWRKTGLIRLPSEGAVAFANRAVALKPKLTGDIREITSCYQMLRYGKKEIRNSEINAFKRLITNFRLK
ncbi:MAG: DUF3488 and transglutaminase-like domain-containing protein [Methylococcaceae bacterium]